VKDSENPVCSRQAAPRPDSYCLLLPWVDELCGGHCKEYTVWLKAPKAQLEWISWDQLQLLLAHR